MQFINLRLREIFVFSYAFKFFNVFRKTSCETIKLVISELKIINLNLYSTFKHNYSIKTLKPNPKL